MGENEMEMFSLKWSSKHTELQFVESGLKRNVSPGSKQGVLGIVSPK
jgi:hypothetical protein